MLKVQCIATEPYAPPFELTGRNYAPWKPGEERLVDDELGYKLASDRNFSIIEKVNGPPRPPEPIVSQPPFGKKRVENVYWDQATQEIVTAIED